MRQSWQHRTGRRRMRRTLATTYLTTCGKRWSVCAWRHTLNTRRLAQSDGLDHAELFAHLIRQASDDGIIEACWQK